MRKFITQDYKRFGEIRVVALILDGMLLLSSIRFHALVLITCLAASIQAQGSLNTWHPAVIAVNLTVTGHAGGLFTRLELAEHGDVRVTYEQKGVARPLSGTFLVISGHWVLVKGLQPERGHETDLLDTAGLNSQLLLTLLSKGLPDGPPASGQIRKISVMEKKEPITLATGSASGVYKAPWSVKGSVTSVSESVVDFSLDLKLEREKNQTVHLEGTVSNPRESLKFPDAMSLSGWSVHTISPYREQTSIGTILNYGVKEEEVSARTLGELRAIDLH